MTGRALEYLASVPLAVTPEAIEAGRRIAARETPGPSAVEAGKGRDVDGAQAGMQRRGAVCVIPIVGPIFRYANWFAALCGGATVEDLARDLRMAVDDPMCESVILSIDSPGGEAAGIAELAAMIRAAAGRKPVVAYVGHQGCSAAYWLAAACSEIVLASTGMVGSIGVVMGYPRKDANPNARSVEFVSSQSPNKRPDVDEPEGRAEVQRLVDDLAEEFVSAVAEYRDVAPETVLADFGRGGILVGRKAVAAGMADRVGTFEGLLAEMAGGTVPRRAGMTQAAAPGASNPEGSQMFKFLFRAEQKADGKVTIEPVADAPAAEAAPTAGAPAPAPVPQPEAADKDARIADLTRQLAESKKGGFEAAASGWYDRLFAANKIVPAEKDDAVAAHVQAALDDFTSPVAAGKSRVARLEGVYEARTAHTLDREQIDPARPAPAAVAGATALPERKGDEGPVSEARLNQLLGYLVDAGQASPDLIAKK